MFVVDVEEPPAPWLFACAARPELPAALAAAMAALAAALARRDVLAERDPEGPLDPPGEAAALPLRGMLERERDLLEGVEIEGEANELSPVFAGFSLEVDLEEVDPRERRL